MAIWQFSVDFIPRLNLIKRFSKIPKKIDDEVLWKGNLEERVALPENYESFLSRLGEKGFLKWTYKSYNWGDYDNGTHLTVSFNKENEASVYCRFHVGEWDEEFAKVVLTFAKMCDCVLLTKNKNIIEPELNLFVEEMKNSNSYRFCQNPVEYLQSDEVKQLNWSIKEKLKNLSE